MKKFDSELLELQNRMSQMASLAQSMVALAITAVQDRSKNVREEVDQLEVKIDQMQMDIDRDAVRIRAGPDSLGDVLQIDLMADAGAGRHNLQIVECPRTPFEEGVAFGIALIFDLDIALERMAAAGLVCHDAMVDDEMDRHLRIDA